MELSVLIPSRNEEWTARTVRDIIENSEAETEVIVVLDGEWANPPIPQHERVNVIYLPEAVGQRKATNIACDLARGKYVMKVDAHCCFDKGFDRKMIEAFEEVGDNVIMAPLMRNLHAFDWKCYKCGKRTYQDTIPKCPLCGTEMKKKEVWVAKLSPQSYSFCFDSEPHFQYFGQYKARQIGDIVESMSLQGSCFMCTKEKYKELNVCDETLGSWGNQGIELACKFWLSGGKVLINKKTYYAHMFRTKGVNGFGFPYKNSEKDVQICKRKVKELFWDFKYDKQRLPVSWLVKKFWPVKGWSEEDLKKLEEHETKFFK